MASPKRILKTFEHLGKRLIYSKHMYWGITLASFLESIIVPIPLETILVPLMQARRREILIIASLALLGCLLGASVGYAVGYFVFDAVGDQLVSLFATQEQYEQVRSQMQAKGFWFVFSVGVIPIPFQIAMLAAGATQYSFALYLAASALSRSIRYYGLGLLVWIAGNQAQRLFQRHTLTASLALAVIVLGIWVITSLSGS